MYIVDGVNDKIPRMLTTSFSGSHTSLKNLSENTFSRVAIGKKCTEFLASTPTTGVSLVVMSIIRSVWLSNDCRTVPVVCNPALSRLCSCSRFSARVCMGLMA
ncbi:Uncharacterised protein [Mycobacteroides abscessus]|nr:Uncharacterised protein [Mycobacteroides abscessus]SIK65952.1 Uncharacterised protein [Mycobacteroides abscessus subsp. abscessus]